MHCYVGLSVMCRVEKKGLVSKVTFEWVSEESDSLGGKYLIDKKSKYQGCA